ncbi:hypothetical protein NDU88_005623 [Pleurodeles waltl]|uniref:Secreted protein n=1 Tax=Pleurodeles waltl TaxID=8319 RepID=A0AAV7N132_PLEWA|nr:hypothetical protein NDU88_005623 [Pleurodeles waltl]
MGGASFSPYLLVGSVLLQTPVFSGAIQHRQRRSTLLPSRGRHLCSPRLGTQVLRSAARYLLFFRRPLDSVPQVFRTPGRRSELYFGLLCSQDSSSPAATAGSSTLRVRLHQLQAR